MPSAVAIAWPALTTVLAARNLRRDTRIVLNLHSIGPVSNPFWPAMPSGTFDRLLEFVSRAFEVRTLRDLWAPSRRPVAVLSFDDGYGDFVEHAAPRLLARGLPANLNVITDAIESGRPPWNIQMYDWLAEADDRAILSLDIPGWTPPRLDGSAVSRARFGASLSAYLKHRPRETRQTLLSAVTPLFESARPIRRMMTKSELNEVAQHFEIGSHSASHESMGAQDDAFFRADFERSAAWLRATIGLRPTVYAFPNGSYRQPQIDHLLSRGVERVLLVGEHFARAPRRETPDARVIPRVSVSASTFRMASLESLGLREATS